MPIPLNDPLPAKTGALLPPRCTSTHYAPVTATASVPLAITIEQIGQEADNPLRHLLALSLLLMIILLAVWWRTFFDFIQQIRYNKA